MEVFRPKLLDNNFARNGMAHIIDAVLDSGAVLLRNFSVDSEWLYEAICSDKRLRIRLLQDESENHRPKFEKELSTIDSFCRIRGPLPLPLHTDGVISQDRVDVIILYAKDVGPCVGGQTLVVRQSMARSSMTTELLTPIENHQFEYQIHNDDYFHHQQKSWQSIPPVRDFGRLVSLNLALPFSGPFFSDKPSWRVRLKNVNNVKSVDYFVRLTRHFLDPRWCYVHHWQVGDVLLLDNLAILHGRMPFSLSDHRVLRRIQCVIHE